MGAWVWTEEKLIISPVRHNCTGLCWGDLNSAQCHDVLATHGKGAHSARSLSGCHHHHHASLPSMLLFPHQHLFSAGGMCSGIRLAFPSAREGMHCAPPSSSKPLPSPDHQLYGFSSFILSLWEPQLSTRVPSDLDFSIS